MGGEILNPLGKALLLVQASAILGSGAVYRIHSDLESRLVGEKLLFLFEVCGVSSGTGADDFFIFQCAVSKGDNPLVILQISSEGGFFGGDIYNTVLYLLCPVASLREGGELRCDGVFPHGVADHITVKIFGHALQLHIIALKLVCFFDALGQGGDHGLVLGD